MHKLLTVDIWDTLLRRNCHPEAVKLATAQHLFLRFPGRFAAGFHDHWALYGKRPEIEHVMAQEAEAAGFDGEYAISAVMVRWLKAVLAQPYPGDIDRIAEGLVETELAFEMENTRRDPDVAAILARHPAEQTLFLSDFYMPGPLLSRLLAHHHLEDSVPSGHVSCDLMRNKRSGRLFTYIHEKYGVRPDEHVHVGDNLHSDVAVARRLGITAVAFLPEDGHAARMAREALFPSRRALFAHLHAATRDELMRSRQADPAQDSPFRHGAAQAMTFMAATLAAAERAIMKGGDGIALGNDAGFSARLFRTLFPDGRHGGHDIPLTGGFGQGDEVLPASFREGAGRDRLDVPAFQDGILLAARIWAPVLRSHAVMARELEDATLPAPPDVPSSYSAPPASGRLDSWRRRIGVLFRSILTNTEKDSDRP